MYVSFHDLSSICSSCALRGSRALKLLVQYSTVNLRGFTPCRCTTIAYHAARRQCKAWNGGPPALADSGQANGPSPIRGRKTSRSAPSHASHGGYGCASGHRILISFSKSTVYTFKGITVHSAASCQLRQNRGWFPVSVPVRGMI
jgi:hypothetical protein